ncbi:MAG: hypothetical protein LKE79_00175 [Lachnospiraceae bacterium]|nr:hypothetical protein [Lachnospiraceae bacterium]MCH4063042.1 hypothetical protein [Lachnospiraceae bacterium]MCH4104349.1 hypothetical protein [Lachnospiraceae bacterium]MCI1334768.1 hypothetical protein [Lachnospiraceae bacterium]MCI1358860.1 hypothetical protein [Lachnospiraceae bacterium]
MERLQVGICEDDSQERERLLTMVNASAERVEAETFGSAEELLAAFYDSSGIPVGEKCHFSQ